MAVAARSRLLALLAAAVASAPIASRAECGGNIQCIAVGPTPAAAAVAHHGLGPDTFTMAFAAQVPGTQSVAQPIHVAAVLGPAGTMATLGAPRLEGPGAADFAITGGSCSAARGPVHGGEGCTIEVAFRPTGLGEKTATVHVPLDPPACAGCLVERTVTLTGVVGRLDPSRDPAVAGLVAAQLGAARRFAQAQVGNVTGRLESLHARGAAPAKAGEARLWLSGLLGAGSRGKAGTASLLDFTTDGVTVGADRAFGNGLVAGIALGAARDRTDIGIDGTYSRARGTSAMAYASYSPAPGLHLDALAGGGPLDFRWQRKLGLLDDIAEAGRDGRLSFAAVTAAWEWDAGGVLLAPYARVDHSRERLDAATESGPAGLALAFRPQDASALNAAAGLRAETIRETRYGHVVPRARLEYRRAVRQSSEAQVGYADLPGEAPFAIAPEASGRDAWLLGLGLDLLRRDGLVLGLEYGLLRASAQEDSQSIRFTLTQALEGRGAPGWRGELPAVTPRTAEIQVEAGFGHDDNLPRAADAMYRAADEYFTANVRISDAWLVGSGTRAVLAATLGGDRYRTYRGLGRATAGLEAELQFRSSGGFGAPTLALFGHALANEYESHLRDGQRYAIGASVRAAATDRIGLAAILSHNRNRADSTVFDGSDNAFRVHADYRLGDSRTLYLTGEFRRGDIVLATSPLALAAAKHDDQPTYPGGGVADDVFVAPQLVDYRARGDTSSVAAGLNLPVGPRESIDLSWRYVRSTPSNAADLPAGLYAGGGKPTYTVNQFMLLYLMSF